MHPFGPEQAVPGRHSRASPEDQVPPSPYVAEDPLLVPLAPEGSRHSHHSHHSRHSQEFLLAPDRMDNEPFQMYYLIFVMVAMLTAGILGSVLTLAALSVSGSPGKATSVALPPFVVPTLHNGTGPSSIITAMPGSATTPAAGSTAYTNHTPSVISTASVAYTTTGTTPGVVGRQVKVFSRGKLYHRSGYLDEAGGSLFVGAMNRLFKLRLDDISSMPAVLGPAVECGNHIRVVQPIGNGSTLYVCGTNARQPTDWQVRAMDLSLVPVAEQVAVKESNETGKAEGRCSYLVSQDATSLWLGLWPLKRGGHVIYRSAIPERGTNRDLHNFLLTDNANTLVLNEPHAVGALSLGAHAYFIFREDQAERRACGIRVVSAMGRVCKNDLGGDPGDRARRQQWTSYMKVRLHCTDFSRSPRDTARANFTYDEIHGSSWVPDLENGVLFGTFVTVTNGYPDSAVCAFRREDIERAFNGTSFIRLALGRNTVSTAMSVTNTTYSGTGSACVPDSRTLSRSETDFLLSNPLLAEPPRMRHNRAFYTLPGAAFSAMVAFVLSETWGSWVICYVATEASSVLKLAQEIVTGSAEAARAHSVDAFNVPGDGIQKLLVSVHSECYHPANVLKISDCRILNGYCGNLHL